MRFHNSIHFLKTCQPWTLIHYSSQLLRSTDITVIYATSIQILMTHSCWTHNHMLRQRRLPPKRNSKLNKHRITTADLYHFRSAKQTRRFILTIKNSLYPSILSWTIFRSQIPYATRKFISNRSILYWHTRSAYNVQNGTELLLLSSCVMRRICGNGFVQKRLVQILIAPLLQGGTLDIYRRNRVCCCESC